MSGRANNQTGRQIVQKVMVDQLLAAINSQSAVERRLFGVELCVVELIMIRGVVFSGPEIDESQQMVLIVIQVG